MTMDPVVHFEMPYKDSKRTAAFYANVFGWKMQDAGEAMGHYMTAATAESDAKGHPTVPGVINGGFYPQDAAKEATAPSLVIAVDNVQESMKKVKDAGGTVLGEPHTIPGIGIYVSITDTEGNRISMLQPAM